MGVLRHLTVFDGVGLQKAGGMAMRKNLLAWVLAASALLGGIGSAGAEEFGTSAQAKA